MPVVITVVGGLIGFCEGEELIAHIKEGGRLCLPAEFELEDRAIEIECSFDIIDFKRDMVDADEASGRVSELVISLGVLFADL